MILGIILLVLILILIFRDIVVKLIKGKKLSFLRAKKIITKEYKIHDVTNKKLVIDVIDTDVKILFDKHINEINIKTMYLIEEFSYDVSYDRENISIERNNRENYKKLGNSGRILIKIPEKSIINDLNILITNGDVEIYDTNINNMVIKGDNGVVKIDSLNAKNINIFKSHGEVNLSHVNLNTLKLDIKDGNGDFVDVYGENINVKVVNGDFVFANVCEEDYKIDFLKVNTLNGKQKLNVNANVLCE